jgi:hypothetical protein
MGAAVKFSAWTLFGVGVVSQAAGFWFSADQANDVRAALLRAGAVQDSGKPIDQQSDDILRFMQSAMEENRLQRVGLAAQVGGTMLSLGSLATLAAGPWVRASGTRQRVGSAAAGIAMIGGLGGAVTGMVGTYQADKTITANLEDRLKSKGLEKKIDELDTRMDAADAALRWELVSTKALAAGSLAAAAGIGGLALTRREPDSGPEPERPSGPELTL